MSISIILYTFFKDGIVTKWTLSDRGRKAESILSENPYDVDAWGVLLREAQVIFSLFLFPYCYFIFLFLLYFFIKCYFIICL